jgi:hypothetical protein
MPHYVLIITALAHDDHATVAASLLSQRLYKERDINCTLLVKQSAEMEQQLQCLREQFAELQQRKRPAPAEQRPIKLAAHSAALVPPPLPAPLPAPPLPEMEVEEGEVVEEQEDEDDEVDCDVEYF